MYILERPYQAPAQLGEPPGASQELILDDFDFNLADLKKVHRDKIDQLAQRIIDSWKPASTRPALAVWAVGHTDNVGGVDFNLDLGRRRAESVMGRLTGFIIKGDIDTFHRMTWSRSSKGKASPRSSVAAQNRRVEIFIEWGRVKPPPPPPPPRPPRQRDPKCAAECNAEESRCLDNTRFPPECTARRADCVRRC